MASNRREYYKNNRKRIQRELKNTVNGVLSACFGCTAVVLFFVGVARAFSQAGLAGALLGTLGLFGLVFALGGLAMGIVAKKEPNARPIWPRLGMTTGGILTVVYLVLYIVGMVAQ